MAIPIGRKRTYRREAAAKANKMDIFAVVMVWAASVYGTAHVLAAYMLGRFGQ